jgi:hypothetical protein
MATKVNRAWFIDKLGKIGIIEKGTNAVTRDGWTTDWTSISVVKSVRLYAISKDSDISVNELTNTFNQIPTQFHETLVYKAIAMGYKDPRNMDLPNAQYFDSEYERGVREGRKFGKSNYTDVGRIISQDF